MRFLLRWLGIALLASSALAAAEPAATLDWAAFLARSDLTWSGLPRRWEEGAFLGNGNLGANIFVQDGALAWEVNRADVYHTGSSGAQRYPMGRVTLQTAGKITGGETRLDLWNAEARGDLRTDRGQIQWRCFTHARDPVTLIALETSEGEQGARLEFAHAEAIPARNAHQKEPVPAGEENPEATFGKSGEIAWCLQPFKAGGGYALAWGEREIAPGKRLLAFTVDYAARDAPRADKAAADIRADT